MPAAFVYGAWWMVHASQPVQCAPPPFCSNRFRSWLLAVALVMFALASPPASFPRSADEQGNLNLASKCEGLFANTNDNSKTLHYIYASDVDVVKCQMCEEFVRMTL